MQWAGLETPKGVAAHQRVKGAWDMSEVPMKHVSTCVLAQNTSGNMLHRHLRLVPGTFRHKWKPGLRVEAAKNLT